MKPNPKLGLFAEVGIPPTPRPRRDKTPPPTFPEYIAAEFGLECLTEYQFNHTRKWRFDYAIPAYKIAIEQEGGTWINGRHIRPQTYLRDMEKYNAAAAAGWLLIRATPQNLLSVETRECIKQAIATRKREVGRHSIISETEAQNNTDKKHR